VVVVAHCGAEGQARIAEYFQLALVAGPDAKTPPQVDMQAAKCPIVGQHLGGFDFCPVDFAEAEMAGRQQFGFHELQP
jgi:hypothetical protein